MSNQNKSYFFAGLTILSWSTVATAFKLALAVQSVYQVLMVASLSSVVVLGISLFFGQKYRLLAKITRKEILYSALLGGMNPFFYYLILFKAYGNLPAQVAQPLNLIWPIVLVILSAPFLGQKIKPASFFALLISFGGIILVSSQGGGKNFDPEQLPYMFLAVSTSVVWAFYWILNIRDKRDESIKLFLSFLFGTLYLLTGSLFVENPFPGQWKHWVNDIYIGFFEMGLAFLFWLKALQYSRSTDKISNLVFIFPFISLIFIHLVLNEEIHTTTLYGLILVVTGIVIQKISDRKKKNEIA